jgi:flagellar biosynthesis protein FlhG
VPQPHSRVITAIASGKGGVGKTWLAITLCHALAKHGKTALLFDGDLGMANVDIQLGLMPDQDLGGVIAGGLDLRSAITRLADSRAKAGGFDIIAGKSGSGALAQLGRSQIKALGSELRLLSGGYDHVILDLGAGLEAGVQSLAESAATTLVVVTDEPTSLTDAYAFIKVQAMRRPGADLRIVVNMAPGRRDGERTYTTLRRACEGFLKFTPPLAGIIRRDDNVRDAIRRQTPMLARHPLSPAAEDVEKIAETLTS